MVRRSTAERSPHSVEHDLGYEAETEYSQPDAIGRSRPTRTWRGAGGRWLIWLFRGVAWAVLLIIGYRGVVAIVTGETQSGSPATPTTSGSPSSSFPVTQADAYALQFGQVYLNYSPARCHPESECTKYLSAVRFRSATGLEWNWYIAIAVRGRVEHGCAGCAPRGGDAAGPGQRAADAAGRAGLRILRRSGRLGCARLAAGPGPGQPAYGHAAQHRLRAAGHADEPVAGVLPGVRQR